MINIPRKQHLAGVWFVVMCAGACSSVLDRPQPVDVVVLPERSYDSSPASLPVSTQGITASSPEASFWWWTEAVAKSGMDGDDPPAKTRYIALDRWVYDGEGITTSPHKVDLASSVVNNSNVDFKGKIKLQISARFEDYENAVYSDKGSSCEERPWVNERTVFERDINVQQKRAKKFERENYDLTKLLNEKYENGSICSMRIVVQVLDPSGSSLTSTEKIIPIQLGD